MLLITSIAPRRDGTVVAKSPDNLRSFTFKPDNTGQLVCEVDHDDTVAHLLRSELFYPADEADFAAAIQLTNPAGLVGGDADGGGEDGHDGGDGGEDEPEDDAEDESDEGDIEAAPVEAGTQPVAATPAAVRRKRNR